MSHDVSEKTLIEYSDQKITKLEALRWFKERAAQKGLDRGDVEFKAVSDFFTGGKFQALVQWVLQIKKFILIPQKLTKLANKGISDHEKSAFHRSES